MTEVGRDGICSSCFAHVVEAMKVGCVTDERSDASFQSQIT